MPYNTRRKSLSLPSLGIQLPNASRAHRSALAKTSSTSSSPPSKRVKRSHTSASPSPTSPVRPRAPSITKNVSFVERPKSSGRAAYEHTPPASPGPSTYKKVDLDGIKDEIVTGVIEQLEKTGNRPHLIRELATVLSYVCDAVSSSANPGALLSSRLSAYLKRPCWSALSPCPLDKELTDVHPRKAYFFLTTRPRQEIPADSTDIIDASDPVKGGKRIISPSISNTSVDGDAEAAEERKREALSPSPEVDLSVHDIVTAPHETNPEFITPGTPGISFAERSSLSKRGSNNSSNGDALAHSNRAASPPLEGDEREFTQTASIVRMRGTSLDNHIARPEIRHPNETFTEETEEEKAKHNREAAEALFGPHNHASASLVMMSSPLVKPLQPTNTEAKIKKEDTDVNMQEESRTWLGDNTEELMWDASQPEDIQIEDLDDLFMAY